MELEIMGLSKRYKRKDNLALDNVSMKISKGVYGLLGENGAGKTTLMKIVATITSPTSGKVLYDGKDISKCGDEFRSKLGYLSQSTKLQPQLTAPEFLDYMCLLKGIKDKNIRHEEVEKHLELVGLQNEKKKKLSAYSGGMLRRIGIAHAFLGHPECVIIDEPTSGLDPVERVYFRNLLSRLGTQMTIIVSTHIIADVESICENVGILKQGKLIYHGSANELVHASEGVMWEERFKCESPDKAEGMMQKLQLKCTVISVKYENQDMLVHYCAEKPLTSDATLVPTNLEAAYFGKIGGREHL